MEKMNFGLDEMHRVQLDMFKTLVGVCEEQGLTYYLAFGSLLGAVRDHRIIPWDDSIDVVMPYQDYRKLLDLPREVWGERLFLQTADTDPGYPRCYAKLRDSGTTLIKSEYAAIDMNHGIYINIMPLIRLADNAADRRKQLHAAAMYKSLTEGAAVPSLDGISRLYAAFLLTLPGDTKRRLMEKWKDETLAFEGQETADRFVMAGNVSLKLALPAKWFETSVPWTFEELTVNIPKGYDEWLRLRYGDYMVAPISDIQGDKISTFVTLNTHKPYTEYKGKTYCV